jgi:hypothetical protein
MLADQGGNVLPLLPYDLAQLTGPNGPSYWTLSNWFVFLHDQSIARVPDAELRGGLVGNWYHSVTGALTGD